MKEPGISSNDLIRPQNLSSAESNSYMTLIITGWTGQIRIQRRSERTGTEVVLSGYKIREIVMAKLQVNGGEVNTDVDPR